MSLDINQRRGIGPAWATSQGKRKYKESCAYCGETIGENEERYNMRFACPKVAYASTYCFETRGWRQGWKVRVTIDLMLSGRVHRKCATEMQDMPVLMAERLAEWAQLDNYCKC